MLARVQALVAAVCPITGVAYINGVDHTGGIRIDYAAGATVQQQTNAQAVVAGFDWSDLAHETWLESREAELADLKAQAQGAIDTNTTYLALASPNNAAVAAQVRALTQQNTRVIRALYRTIQRTWR